jgi:hypothetical protein
VLYKYLQAGELSRERVVTQQTRHISLVSVYPGLESALKSTVAQLVKKFFPIMSEESLQCQHIFVNTAYT